MTTHRPLDLPALQNRLDALAAGGTLSVASAQAERLFGVKDVALRRLELFAAGHRCAIDVKPGTVTFRKEVRVDASAAPNLQGE